MDEAQKTMQLPPGKTCADCWHFKRTCEWLISCEPTRRECDWAPSRFAAARQPAEQGREPNGH